MKCESESRDESIRKDNSNVESQHYLRSLILKKLMHSQLSIVLIYDVSYRSDFYPGADLDELLQRISVLEKSSVKRKNWTRM